jgi:hypothetical protein
MTFILAVFMMAAGDFTGTWNIESQDDSGNIIKSQLVLREEAGGLKGEIKAGNRAIALEKVTVAGENLSFPLQWGDQPLTISLTLKDGALSGNWKTPEGDTGRITGKKAEAAAAASSHPAAGLWKLTAVSPNGNEIKAEFNLEQAGGAWKGELRSPNGAMPVAELQVGDGVLSFKVQAQSPALVTMKLADGVWKGNYKTDAGDAGPIELRR